MRKLRPEKKHGRAQKAPVRRTFNGAVLDVASGAAYLGTTEKAVRAMVARRTVPFRRLGGRIVLVRAELDRFLLEELGGCSAAEAVENVQMRSGSMPRSTMT